MNGRILWPDTTFRLHRADEGDSVTNVVLRNGRSNLINNACSLDADGIRGRTLVGEKIGVVNPNTDSFDTYQQLVIPNVGYRDTCKCRSLCIGS